MFVCICNKVTDTEIEAELESGNASSFEDIQRKILALVRNAVSASAAQNG